MTVMFHGNDRGQTLFDFVIGITLFLFIIFFVVLFIPGLLDPFETTRDANTITADRGADHLTQSVLRDPGAGPYVLNDECTTAFFNGHPSTACSVTTDDLHSILGLNNQSHVNITISNPDGDTVVLDGVELQTGDSTNHSQSRNTYTSTRVVTINGNQYEFRYEVW